MHPDSPSPSVSPYINVAVALVVSYRLKRGVIRSKFLWPLSADTRTFCSCSLNEGAVDSVQFSPISINYPDHLDTNVFVYSWVALMMMMMIYFKRPSRAEALSK